MCIFCTLASVFCNTLMLTPQKLHLPPFLLELVVLAPKRGRNVSQRQSSRMWCSQLFVHFQKFHGIFCFYVVMTYFVVFFPAVDVRSFCLKRLCIFCKAAPRFCFCVSSLVVFSAQRHRSHRHVHVAAFSINIEYIYVPSKLP